MLMLESIHCSFRTLRRAWNVTQLEDIVTGSPGSTVMSQPTHVKVQLSCMRQLIHPKAGVPGCQQIQAEMGKANI